MRQRLSEILIRLCIAIIAGIILMTLAYCAPISQIKKHLAESVDILKNETDSYGFAPRVSTSYPDHVTDALMLCEAVAPRTESVIKDAMNANWIGLDEYGHIETIIHVFEDDRYDEVSLCPYPRYWHGYLVWLKPLLSVMSYSEIRILSMWFQLALLCIVMYQLIRKDKRLAIAFFVSVMFLNPITSAISMQYASVYCVTLIMTIIMLGRDAYRSDKCWRLFMWGGISVAFFDFFTYPVVALGIPLIIYISLSSEKSVKKSIFDMFKQSIYYLAGYGGMWSGKWIFASILLGENIIAKSMNQIVYRMNAQETSAPMTILYVLRQVLMHLNNKPMKIAALVGSVWFIAALVSGKYAVVINKKMIPIIITAMYPFVWYAVVKNHSATHARIEQREMAVTIMAIIVAVLMCLKINEKNNLDLSI